MQTFKLFAGIDISKAKLDICLISDPNNRQHQHLTVANTYKGIASILKLIDNQGYEISDVLFCMEHTGVYGIPLCCYLQQQKACYWAIPAIEIKRSKGLKRGKTDKTDAKDIALYSITHTHKLQLSSLPETNLMKLRLLISEREKVVKAISMFENTGEASDFLPKTVLADVMKINRSTLALLQKKQKQLDKVIADVVKQDQLICKQFDLCRSIPGVGPQTAIHMVVYTRCFEALATWRKFACYAGIAPFEYHSGSSIRARTKVSHLANKKLKSLLNMAALTAKKYDPELRRYYERKTAEGKNPMLVMNAIRCKLVARIFATVKRDTPFVNIQKFAA